MEFLVHEMKGTRIAELQGQGILISDVGDFSRVQSPALRDFIRESNETGEIVFVPDIDTAIARLAED